MNPFHGRAVARSRYAHTNSARQSGFPLSTSRLNELIRAWLGWFVLSAVGLRMPWLPHNA